MSRNLKLGPVTETVNTEELFHVISEAASQDPARLQASSKRLKEMLDMFGTFDGLSDIASQKAVPLAVRQQSIIQFKNSALSHWRSRKYLSDEARIRIRSRCLTFLDEEDDIIAECNELIVAKIARSDFPLNWSPLITDLMSVIDNNLQLRYASQVVDPRVTLTLRRSIKVLDEVLKEFLNYKMLTGIKTMGNLVEYLNQPLSGYYERLSSTFVSFLNPSTISLPRTADDLLLAHLVYKCLVKMSTWLWQRPDKNSAELHKRLQPWLETVFQNSALQLKSLFDLRINLVKALHSSSTTPDAVARRSIDQLSRHVRLLGKFFRRLQQLDASQFVKLPMCNNVILYYWAKVVEATNASPQMIFDSNEAVYPLRILVQAMVLFKESLAQWTPTPKDGVPKENTLSQQFVEDAVKLLVTRCIPLNPADLEGWMADPEEWVNLEDKENLQWEYELRPCGERVLMTLCNQYKDYVVPLLERTFKQIIAQPTIDLPSVIQKEALYCAIGRCATRLEDVIPFDQWLEHSLIAEARDTNPNFPIIKRRIAWLIGQWISSQCSLANNPRIWDVLVHLLQDRGPGTDAVVRLTAAAALRECVDSLGFDANVFAPYLSSTVTELVKLVGEADTLESKRRITSSLNVVIERAEIRIVPLIPIITSAIPQYWTSAGNDYLFKATLLTLVTALVNACREHSAALGGIVVPLLRESLSPEAITHLDEYGLVLWQAALRNTVTIESVNGAPALIDIFPLLISLLAVNLDLLGKIIGLVESYFLLGAPLVLQNFAVDLFCAILSAITGPAISINIKDMVVSVNLLMQLAPPSLWGEAMHTSGLFTHLIKTILDEETPVIQSTEFIYILARIAIADRQMFLQLMSATAISQNTSESLLYTGLMDMWWTRFDSMSEPRHRKLTAMGIASLVSTGRPEVLQRLSTEIFNLWMDVFSEIKEAYDQTTATGSSSPLLRFWDQDEPPSSYYQETEGTPEFDRRKALFERDPVRTTLLSQFVAARLQDAEASSGGSQAFQAMYLENADPTVVQQIQGYLNST